LDFDHAEIRFCPVIISVQHVAGRDPGFDAFLTPGSGMGKKSRSGSGSRMSIPDHISESLETVFWVKKYLNFYTDPDPGSGIFLILDPGLTSRIRNTGFIFRNVSRL
jgi:hypothetical protein